MRHQNSVFHSVLKHVPWAEFDRLVEMSGADARVRRLTTKGQFVALAGVVSHGIVFPALAWRPFSRAARMTETALIGDVIVPWAIRFLPIVVLSVAIQQVIGVPRVPAVMAIGGAVAVAAMWYMRPLYLQFGPVRAMYDRLFARLGLA